MNLNYISLLCINVSLLLHSHTYNVVHRSTLQVSNPLIIFKVEVAYLVEELETFSERLDHFFAGFALLNGGIILAQELSKINTVVIECPDQLLLSHIFGLIDKECHNSLGHHVVHALADRVEIGDDQALDNVRLKLRTR